MGFELNVLLEVDCFVGNWLTHGSWKTKESLKNAPKPFDDILERTEPSYMTVVLRTLILISTKLLF